MSNRFGERAPAPPCALLRQLPWPILGLLCACSDSAGPVVGAPAALEIVSGNEQSAVVGTELPNPLVARVVDSAGHAVRGQLVNFRVTAGGGNVFAGAALTNDSGIAQERWTLGLSTADSQRVEARAVDNNTGAPLVFAVFAAIPLPAPVSALVKVQGDTQSALIGAALPETLIVKVVDGYGNGVSGVTTTWTATHNGSFQPSNPVTDANGVARARWTLGRVPGPDTATVSATGVTAARFSGRALLGFLDVGAGQGHACGIGLDSLAYCWGRNDFGQIGVSPGPDFCAFVDCSDQAIRISGNAKFRSVAVGWFYNCAIATAGGSFCWGSDRHGQLGDGRFDSTATIAQPVQVQASVAFVSVAAGAEHACGVTAQGVAYCWGWNGAGQLGDSTTTDRSTPVQVKDTVTWQTLAPGFNHTCGLSQEGRVWCWGDNHYGQLGTDTANTRDACHTYPTPFGGQPETSYCSYHPIAVGGALRFTSILSSSTEADFSCGLATDGAFYCWGMGQAYGSPPGLQGQQCPGEEQGSTAACSMQPVAIAWGVSLAALAANGYLDCGINTTADAYCRSPGYGGWAGDGTNLARSSMTLVVGGHKFSRIAVGEGFTCGVAQDGSAYCWGNDGFGQVGAGAVQDKVLSPAKVIF